MVEWIEISLKKVTKEGVHWVLFFVILLDFCCWDKQKLPANTLRSM